ncbi:MAG TPA: putative glycolipid-binding domain-containing protein [Thermomicrobiales bacterium]|nr:putative glycolipid-binding domain-containing protein [Thermomicrobiales bacterium]
MIWRSTGDPGFEHVRIDEGHPEWTVFDSMFVREHEGVVRRGGYTLIVDKAWRVLELRLMVEQAPGSMTALHIMASGDGRWVDANQNPIPALDGCIDIDIRWSPLTNTLPIRRLALGEEEREIRVAYVSLPDLDIRPVTQRYRRVDDATVRYWSESLPEGVLIAVDEDAFVVDYPGAFHREWPLPDAPGPGM